MSSRAFSRASVSARSTSRKQEALSMGGRKEGVATERSCWLLWEDIEHSGGGVLSRRCRFVGGQRRVVGRGASLASAREMHVCTLCFSQPRYKYLLSRCTIIHRIESRDETALAASRQHPRGAVSMLCLVAQEAISVNNAHHSRRIHNNLQLCPAAG